MIAGDTIAAIATAPGLAGVAVVRVSGPDAFAIAEKLTLRPVAPGRIACRKLFQSSTFNLQPSTCLDTAVVLAFQSPHSYTGEDVVEFQCHGGAVTPRRVLEACFAAGARLARRGEFTERAFLNGRLDYDQAESVLDLIHAKTARSADAALAGLDGRRERANRALYEEALALSTELEHALDIDEGELPCDFAASVSARLAALAARLREELQSVRERRILNDGALVVLAGEPNAGKSSLLNALLEENRAIVSDVAGTTRDSIEAWLDLEGFPVRLVDTAGLRETGDAIESEGVKRARELIDAADLVIDFSGALELTKAIAIHAKCDLGGAAADGVLAVSAKTGEGIAALKAELVRRLAALAPREEPHGADKLLEAVKCLEPQLGGESSSVPGFPFDPVLAANAVRSAAEALGALVGATYSADLLDRLFSRFCVGK